MEAAFQYVLEKINCGMTIKGMQRQDVYELPLDSVRELIANSIAHRSYLEHGNIQIALFDDRLEVTSPGMLLNGVSIAKMMEGYSKIRNRAIANAFSYMKIIEKWGSGIPRIMRECKEYGLPEPEFLDFDGDFRVNMYRKTTESANYAVNKVNSAQSGNPVQSGTAEMPDQEMEIARLVKRNGSCTTSQVAELLAVKDRRARVVLGSLVKKKILKKRGNARNTVYLAGEQFPKLG